MIKIGIQKSGRLNQNSIDLLKNCGISIENFNDQLKVSASNFPLDIYFLRNGDLPKYIKDGVIRVFCTDWDKKFMEEKYNKIYTNTLSVNSTTDELRFWIQNEAYK